MLISHIPPNVKFNELNTEEQRIRRCVYFCVLLCVYYFPLGIIWLISIINILIILLICSIF